MDNGRRKDWREFETTEDAARRLLRVLDERTKKKLSGGFGVPEQIQDPRQCVPADRESAAPNQGNQGVCMLDGSAPSAVAGGDYDGCDVGEVGCAGPVEPDDVTMRSPATNADSNRHVLTTGLEGNRAVRWGK